MTLTRVTGAAVGAEIKRQYATVAAMTAGRGLRIGDVVSC